MVFFILTRIGFEELTTAIGRTPSPAWLNHGVLSDGEVDDLRRLGMDLTVFSHACDPQDHLAILDDLSTIQEHHPGKHIWIDGLGQVVMLCPDFEGEGGVSKTQGKKKGKALAALEHYEGMDATEIPAALKMLVAKIYPSIEQVVQ